MRFSDFIQEASIFTKPRQYSFGHKVNVAINSSKGQKLLAAINKAVSDFNGDEVLTWIEPINRRPPNTQVYTVNFGAGGDSRYFRRDNGSILIINGADKSIQGGLTHAKGQKGSTAENAGDASEPVLSAAVVAKMIKRGANNVEDITDEDVKFVLAEALKNPNLEYTVEDKNSKVADIIRFSIMVKKPTMDFLSDPAFWEGKMGKLLPSVIHYANSGHIDKYADYFYKNGKADVVSVKSDGVSEAKSRKTDVEATVNGRPIKGMNVSLKAGSPHIGQVGAGDLKDPFSDTTVDIKTGKTKGRVGIYTATMKLFGPFGITIERPTGPVTSKVLFWTEAYKQAAEQLKQMLAGDDARTEAGVVTKIANFVANHGTSGDPNIKLVSLGTKGVSSVHSFKNLTRKLLAENINLDCVYREGKSKVAGDPRPELRVYDTNSGKDVMFIRYSSTEDEGKIWNTVEMKDLLKELTTLSYKPLEPNTQSTQPAVVKKHPMPTAATPATQHATPAVLPSTAPLAGKNVTNISNGNMVPADREPEEVEMEDWVHPKPEHVGELQRLLQLAKRS